MASPPRWAFVTSAIIVGFILFLTEFVLVFGLTLGVFHAMGIPGWWSIVATIVFALAAVWLLAWLIALLAKAKALLRQQTNSAS